MLKPMNQQERMHCRTSQRVAFVKKAEHVCNNMNFSKLLEYVGKKYIEELYLSKLSSQFF